MNCNSRQFNCIEGILKLMAYAVKHGRPVFSDTVNVQSFKQDAEIFYNTDEEARFIVNMTSDSICDVMNDSRYSIKET